MSKELKVFRAEKKYRISSWQADMVIGKLEAVLKGDSVNGTKPYLVRSLYFDSIYNDDYYDKMLGLERRKKIRLRIYDPDSKIAKLELKEKQNKDQLKRSITVTKEQAEEMIKGNYSFLSEMEEPLAQEILYIMQTNCYRPVCIVEYKRRALINETNDIRITFDSAVSSNEGDFSLFAKNLTTYPVILPDTTIMEVKYNGFLLSYIKDIVSIADAVESSSSKYCMARMFGLS